MVCTIRSATTSMKLKAIMIFRHPKWLVARYPQWAWVIWRQVSGESSSRVNWSSYVCRVGTIITHLKTDSTFKKWSRHLDFKPWVSRCGMSGRRCRLSWWMTRWSTVRASWIRFVEWGTRWRMCCSRLSQSNWIMWLLFTTYWPTNSIIDWKYNFRIIISKKWSQVNRKQWSHLWNPRFPIVTVPRWRCPNVKRQPLC